MAVFYGRDSAVGALQTLRLHAPEWPVQSGIHRIVRIIFFGAAQFACVIEQCFGAKAPANFSGLDEQPSGLFLPWSGSFLRGGKQRAFHGYASELHLV